jgi:hypothetical protein
MTYPDSGAPVDPREELEAIRRRLAELTPAGRRRGDESGLLMAGGLALAGAIVVLLLAIAVAGTLDSGGGQAAVLIAGFCIVAGFAVLGLSLLRRWQDRVGRVRRERVELLTRYDVLAAETGEPRGSAYPPWPSGADRLPMVLGVILGVLVLFAVVIVILVEVS